MKNFGHKLIDVLNKSKENVIYFFKNNVLFTTFIITSLINGCLIRFLTVKNYTAISPILADLAFILVVGSFAYLFKPKNRFKYFITWSIILTLVCLINSVYYTNYVSFTSFSLLATSLQLVGVSDALETIMELKDFCYIWAPLTLIFVHRKLLKQKYYTSLKNKIKPKVAVLKVLVAAAIVLGFFVSTLTGTDISRLYKQWNREYVVMKFGIYTYQGNDLIASLKPQISPLFGYDKAAKEFREFYDNKEKSETNEYTNIFKDKNVIVIHAESMQNYLLDTEINGKVIAPNLKKLASEGMYFSNFYSQESVGTSSDTEFTYSTSLLPASSGTVFVSYWDREYPSIQKFLKEEDYYVFSMHANKGNMWNREVMHKQLGYDRFYYYDKDYNIDETIGLGLSDKSFFKQSVQKIKQISEKHDKYYGLLIMLTNHTPFEGLEETTDLDLTYKYTKTDEITGEKTEVVNDYLSNTTLGKYFTTAHYADEAIGEFVDELDKEGLLEDTVLVIYGDHDAKVKRSEYDYYYNYNPETDSKRSKNDPEYKEFTKYDYELNRKVPFIIWTKDEELQKKINKTITTVTGMYDVLPTLGNMLGINNPYALGHDIFSTDENYVVFPNGNWITDKMYYDSQNGEAIIFDEESVIDKDYISKYTEMAEKEIAVSNDIIVHDLIKKTKETDEVIKGGQK